ncbi:hypothetical protein BLNAU_24073 [Blattamonas nauphoetae]|uniref:Uncharacterized protein n=1 Tax=Blattamonas nauphoetae TaxID=2049346 RepID=A0ABQ9WQH8_9EUKA|nr:hypothetical protein BLNAU_24073 [Blattamonas nauphoetae]
MNRSSYYLFRFCNDLFRSSCTFGLFVSLLQNWQLTLTGIKSFVHIFYSPPYKGSPPFTPLPVLSLSDAQHQPEAEVVKAAPSHLLDSLLTATQVFLFCPSPLHLQRRLANKVWAGDVDLCVLTLSLLTNTHVAVPSSTRNQVKAVGVLSTRKRRETRKSVSAFEEKMSETEAQNSKPAAEQDEPKEQADDDNELFQSHS